MIDIFNVKNWNVCKRIEPIKIEINTAPAPMPKSKKSIFDIGMELIGERNHLSKQALIDKMVQMYHITDTRAEIGLKSLLDSKIIEPTHIGTYVITHSTPF